MAIDRSHLVELACDLVAIDSINPSLDPEGAGEAVIANRLGSELRRIPGVEVELLEHGGGRASVLARLPGGGGPSLMLNGHIDTVDVANMTGPFTAEVRDGRLHGRGAYDMKGSVAACVAALRALAREGPPAGDVWLSAVADEEVASIGTLAVIERLTADGRLPDACIVTEPTALDVCVAHKGFVWAAIETRGRAAHGSRPDLGVDANLQMTRVLTRLEPLLRTLREGEPHPLLGRGSLHIGELAGGTGPSSYAERCRALIERRTLPGETTADVLGELEALVRTASEEHAELEAEVELVLDRPPFEISPDRPIARAVRAAAADVRGVEPELIGVGYWMDAALFAAAGVDTVTIGPAGEGAHAADEWVEVDSVVQLVEILIATSRDFCQA